MMVLIRNLILALGGMVILAFALTAGVFVFAFLAIVGLLFATWFKLRRKDFVNPVDQMGMGREPQSPTIDAEYEVIETEFEVLEEEKQPEEEKQ